MAPNKIYVKEFDGEISQMWSPIKATVTTASAQHEYIRKDALLEWAKEKANDYKGTANIRRSFEMMIRKIESL